MKKIILACILLMSTPAMAATDAEVCTAYSSLASKIMGYRQSGVSFSTLYSAVSDQFKPIVTMAFEEHAYYSPEMQNRARIEFGNTFMRECLKANQK